MDHKSESIQEAVQSLEKSVVRSSKELALSPLTREQRRSMPGQAKVVPTEVRAVVAAAKTHEDLTANLVDPKKVLDDLAFVEAIEPSLEVIESFLRDIADEVLVRKVRMANAVAGVKQVFEGSLRIQPGTNVASALDKIAATKAKAKPKTSKKTSKAVPPAPTTPATQPVAATSSSSTT
jgi:hypothetical protein